MNTVQEMEFLITTYFLGFMQFRACRTKFQKRSLKFHDCCGEGKSGFRGLTTPLRNLSIRPFIIFNPDSALGIPIYNSAGHPLNFISVKKAIKVHLLLFNKKFFLDVKTAL